VCAVYCIFGLVSISVLTQYIYPCNLTHYTQMSEKINRIRDRIWVALLTTDDTVTYRDLSRATGASVQTCRNVVHTAIDEGLAEVVEREPEVSVRRAESVEVVV